MNLTRFVRATVAIRLARRLPLGARDASLAVEARKFPLEEGLT
jgi:hypothetical protein